MFRLSVVQHHVEMRMDDSLAKDCLASDASVIADLPIWHR